MQMILLIITMMHAFAGEGIYNSMCKKTSDCIGHLVCKKKKCTPKDTPTKEKCATFSYVNRSATGQLVTQCPPDCGFKKDLIYGPICTVNQIGCAASKKCRDLGLCEFNGEECVRSEEGCSNSVLCKTKGLCGFDGNKCVPSLAGCASSEKCKTEGWCGYIPGPKGYSASHGRCEITAKGCINSKLCLDKGKCGFESGSCVATKMGCVNATACKTSGLCRFKKFVGCVR